MLYCQYCDRECKNENSLAQHQIRCKHNPDRIIVKSSYGMKGKKGKNQYIKAKELGLPKPEISEETRLKKSIASKNIVWSEDRRKKHSEIMKQVVKDNPNSYTKQNVSGRAKLYDIKDSNGNLTKVKGTWELKVANYLTLNNIHWVNDVDGFSYFWNGDRTYYPDFYCKDINFYIEVKGYETDRDINKWIVVNNLLVIKEDAIKKIDKNIFDIYDIIKGL